MILVTHRCRRRGSVAPARKTRCSRPRLAITRRRCRAVEAGVDVVEGDLDVPESIDVRCKASRACARESCDPAQELNVIESACARRDLELLEPDTCVNITAKPRRLADRSTTRPGPIDMLIASGLAYTLLRTQRLHQNFLMLAPASPAPELRVAHGRRRSAVDYARRRRCRGGDCGVTRPHAGKTFWPTSPERLSYADAARVLLERARPADHLPSDHVRGPEASDD